MTTKLTPEIRAAIKAQLTARPKPKINEKVHRRTAGLWSRPFHSDALGVAPEQIPEAVANLRAHGVTADFDATTGCCIITSDAQFQQVAKARGIWDGRNGYGGTSDSGAPIHTGRAREQAKEEFRAAIERGDFDD